MERQFIQQVEQLEAERHMQYVSSVERFAMQKGKAKGREVGLKEGRQAGAVHFLLRLLVHRFGEIPEALQIRLQPLTLEQTEALVDVALTCQTLTAFADHLPAVAEEKK